MGYRNRRETFKRAESLAQNQHGVLGRGQLLELGVHPQAIKHRVRTGRLYAVRRGVYSVAPELTLHGHWMAAVLSCGPGAVLSDLSAAQLWQIFAPPGATPPSLPVLDPPSPLHVSVPSTSGGVRRDLTLHRRPSLDSRQTTRRYRIPVTTPIATLVDLAASVAPERLERAINEADKRSLVDPDTLRAALDGFPRRRGLAALKAVLDGPTYALTDSELEQAFLRLVKRAGLPMPETQAQVNGFRVDFFWPELGLVVETDGLTYHRTPAQQARDRVRDQVHAAAGLICLRFTHGQVGSEAARVADTLARVAGRLCRR
jgi:very-short-patch-repair endonuclease